MIDQAAVAEVDDAVRHARSHLVVVRDHHHGRPEIPMDLADQGNLKEALNLCGEVLTKNATHVQAHFLMGLVYQALKNDTQAEECFNKTIYLDPNHHEALYYLALIKEDHGEYNTAKQLRQRIQRIYQRTQRD